MNKHILKTALLVAMTVLLFSFSACTIQTGNVEHGGTSTDRTTLNNPTSHKQTDTVTSTSTSASSLSTTSFSQNDTTVFTTTTVKTATTTGNEKPFVPKEEGMDMIWIAPKSIDYTDGMVMEDFVDKLTDARNWPNLLKKTRVLKLYIQQLYTTSQVELRRIADFVREQNLLVAVELGGVRVAPSTTSADKIGIVAAASEYQHLRTFINEGGRVDYITTDHALAANLTGRNQDFPQLTMQGYMEQQMAYYRYMLDRIPDLKVGAIESLGFFRVKSANYQYEQTDPTLPIKLDFETYLSEMVRIAFLNDVKLDHFHIDFGYHDVLYDGGYGRVIAVEEYVHSLGLDSGFIAANAFHAMMDFPTKNEELANRQAYERTVTYFEEYMKAGGKSDYLLFQRWQFYPIGVGTENEKYSSMGIFKAMLDSPYFPK